MWEKGTPAPECRVQVHGGQVLEDGIANKLRSLEAEGLAGGAGGEHRHQSTHRRGTVG